MRTCCELAAQGFRSEGFPIHQHRVATERKILTAQGDELRVGEDVGAPTFKVLLEVGLDNFFHAVFRNADAVEVTA
jgi:hypothetical protein